MSELLDQTEFEDVYLIDCAGWRVSCIVINEAPDEDRNWLWEMMRGDRSRWKSGAISAILTMLEARLKNMGVIDPEIEAFDSEILESWLEELPPEKRLIGLDLKTTAEGRALFDDGKEQGIEQGEGKILVKQISNRFPNISEDQIRQIRALSSAQLEDLAVALFGFENLKGLDLWLKSR